MRRASQVDATRFKIDSTGLQRKLCHRPNLENVYLDVCLIMPLRIKRPRLGLQGIMAGTVGRQISRNRKCT
jgi:hypothetical protein